MEYDFLKAVEEVIEECKSLGTGKVQRKDDCGNVTLWLEAKWVHLPDNKHKIVELCICYSDTGRVAYSRYINETKTKILSTN